MAYRFEPGVGWRTDPLPEPTTDPLELALYHVERAMCEAMDAADVYDAHPSPTTRSDLFEARRLWDRAQEDYDRLLLKTTQAQA